jgi:hypothetical protein
MNRKRRGHARDGGECAGTRANAGVRERCVRIGRGRQHRAEDLLPRLHVRFPRVNKREGRRARRSHRPPGQGGRRVRVRARRPHRVPPAPLAANDRHPGTVGQPPTVASAAAPAWAHAACGQAWHVSLSVIDGCSLVLRLPVRPGTPLRRHADDYADDFAFRGRRCCRGSGSLHTTGSARSDTRNLSPSVGAPTRPPTRKVGRTSLPRPLARVHEHSAPSAARRHAVETALAVDRTLPGAGPAASPRGTNT